jgi:hypothetical protein
MITSQTRWLMLLGGRASVEVWARAAGTSQRGLGSATRGTYDRLAAQVPWPAEQLNRVMLAFLVLPMAALYSQLRERGWSESSAVDAVTRALGVVLVRAERPPIGLLSRTPLGRQVLVQGTATFAAWAPRLVGSAWDVTLVERTPTRMGIDVTRCYVLDTLRLLDAAPAVAAMCAHDTAAYADTCPRIRFTRTGTLGTGADRCDFCLEILPPTPAPGVRQPA